MTETVNFLPTYFGIVFWLWFGIVGGILTVIELARVGGLKIPVLSSGLVRIALLLLVFVANAHVYKELQGKQASPPPAAGVAEDPDHANLAADNRKQADELVKLRLHVSQQETRLSTLETENKALESERDALKAKLDDRQMRKAIRDNLSKLLDEGGRIMAIVTNESQDVPIAQINGWIQRLEKYLASVSPEYVTRSRNGSGVPMGALRTAKPPGAERLQAYGAMHTRLFRLEEFIKELA